MALDSRRDEVLTASPELADYYEHVARAHQDYKAAANWVKGEVLAAVRNQPVCQRLMTTPGVGAAAT